MKRKTPKSENPDVKDPTEEDMKGGTFDKRYKVKLHESCLVPVTVLRTMNNRLLDRSLFRETRGLSRLDIEDAPFHWGDDDLNNGCLSVPKIFRESVTEMEAAMKIVGSWTHWLRLKKKNWFSERIDRCKEEAKAWQESLVYKMLYEKAIYEADVSAAKELKQKYWVEKERGKGPGRPVKDKPQNIPEDDVVKDMLKHRDRREANNK